MSKCIGGIAHEAVGLATHQPSKTWVNYWNTFIEPQRGGTSET